MVLDHALKLELYTTTAQQSAVKLQGWLHQLQALCVCVLQLNTLHELGAFTNKDYQEAYLSVDAVVECLLYCCQSPLLALKLPWPTVGDLHALYMGSSSYQCCR